MDEGLNISSCLAHAYLDPSPKFQNTYVILSLVMGEEYLTTNELLLQDVHLIMILLHISVSLIR